MLTHAEPGAAAQDELGGLGDGAVIHAGIRGVQLADVQAVGLGARPTDGELLRADVAAVGAFAQRVGEEQELELLPLRAPAVPVHPGVLPPRLAEDVRAAVSLG